MLKRSFMACHLWWLCLVNGLTSMFATWIPIADQGRPPGRTVHVAAWDMVDRQLWIFGGSQQEFMKDLWTYDVESNSWSLKPQQNPAPSARGDHVAVWDPCEPALWIHGGFDGNSFFNDLWKFSGNRWVDMTTLDGPSQRSDHVAVWDTANGALWIHGGYNGALTTIMQDVWRFDSLEGVWLLIQDASPPSALARHVGVWDDTNAALWIHGGYDGSTYWVLDAKGKVKSWVMLNESKSVPWSRFVFIWADV